MAAFVLLIILQIADGFFSFHGIQKLGLHNYEANPLMIHLANFFGIVPALLGTKIAAVLMVWLLYKKAKAISVLWFLAGIYSLNLYNQITFFVHSSG